MSRWLLRIAVISLLVGALSALGILLFGYVLSTTLQSTVQSFGTPAEPQPAAKESFDMGTYGLIAGYTFLGCTAITFLKQLTGGRRSGNGRSRRRRER